MSKNALITKATRSISKVGFQLKKHSPEILVVGGVIGTVASAVLACKATTKASVVLQDAKVEISTINACLNDPETAEKYEQAMGEVYTPDIHKKDLTLAYTQTGLKLAKLYAPAVILGALSITSILASNNILRKRNVALAAAYAAVDKGFKEYRGRVVERFGEAVDRELKYNIKAKEIEETVIDEKTGKEKKVKKTINVMEPDGYSMYSRVFDESCYDWEDNADMNKSFLTAQQEFFNHKLKTKGYVFLNDVYEALGFQPSTAGQVVGWLYDPENPDHEGNNYIDFGITDIHREKTRDFINGYEKCIILDFNVDGPIYKTFQKYAR